MNEAKASATRAVYMDYAATTPVDPRVAAAMSECLTFDGCFGNASSTGHAFGSAARARVETARKQVAMLLNCEPAAIVFTSGATESDNLAILGAARFNAPLNAHGGRHVVTARTEHKAVLDPCKQLEKEGFEVTYLKPNADGVITPTQVAEALQPRTVLASLMHVNNEIGVIQDVAAVGRLCRERGVLFHVDAAQSAGKLPIDVDAMSIDLLALTAHKFYGPKGIGALYVRRKPRIGLAPLMFGGGQEWGLRSGTLATHQIVGLGVAAAIAREDMERDAERLRGLRARLWEGLEAIGGVHVNSAPECSIPHVLNVSFEGVEGESLLFGLRGLAVSTGSACNSASQEASYVLRALGRSDALAQGSLRFSMGRFTRNEDIDYALACVHREVTRLRALSPKSGERPQSSDSPASSGGTRS
jgi:cysteine desulfurase